MTSKMSPPTSSRFIYSEKKSPDNPHMVVSEDLVNVKIEEENEEQVEEGQQKEEQKQNFSFSEMIEEENSNKENEKK